MEKILDRSALTQKFGIGGHIKERPRYPVAFDGAPNPVVGIDRHGALFDNDLIGMNGPGNLAGNSIDIRKVSVAGLALRGAYGDENDLRRLGRMAKISGELDLAGSPVPAQQLGQKLFVDGYQPWLSLFTLSSSLSTHRTRWPISAKHAAATKPTYPDPTTVIAIDSLILFSGTASAWDALM